MYRLIEWLVFHLPDKGYYEDWDTSYISWGDKWGDWIHLAVRYWPMAIATVCICHRCHSWYVDRPPQDEDYLDYYCP